MKVFIESLLLGDLTEAKELLNVKLKDLVEKHHNQVKLSLAEDIYGDCGVDVGIDIEDLDEAIANNASSSNAKTPIKPIENGSSFFRQILDSKKLGFIDSTESFIF